MFRANAQSIFANHLGDLCDRPGRFKTEIAHDDKRFVHEHARSLFQFRQRNARIDIAIIIRAAHHDVRGVARGRAEKCADAIGRRSHFLDDLLELVDHAAGFGDGLLLIGNARPQSEQVVPNRIARRERNDHTVDPFQK